MTNWLPFEQTYILAESLLNKGKGSPDGVFDHNWLKGLYILDTIPEHALEALEAKYDRIETHR